MALSVFTESICEFRRFVRRYQGVFQRKAQRIYFEKFLGGLIGPLERKSTEPIALDQDVGWRQLQDFIGCSPWDDEALLAEHRRHVRESLGSLRGIVIIDPTSFPKRGDKSVGVARQWCGQLGKEENCVVQVNLGYASEKGHAFLDRRLYLPREWTENRSRCRAVGVPADVVFRTSWELAYEMIGRARREGFPHAWIIGDEEFGKVPQFQTWLDEDGERYILEVPCCTRVGVSFPRSRPHGPKSLIDLLRVRRPGRPRWVRVDDLKRELSPKAWSVHEIRDASKGPIRVRAALLRVLFRRRKPESRPDGWFLVTQTLDQRSQTKYFHSNAAADASKEILLEAAFARWPVEQCHGQGKDEVGLGHYETRSWQGWHHHTALVLLAHHWLVMERNRLGGKISRDDRRGGPTSLLHRVRKRERRTAQTATPHAASPAPQSECAAVTLET